jgi:pyridoxine 5-phosphate synthase
MTVPMLSVNVDHVATVRQARRVPYPDPVEAARLAEAAGARGVTAHLRADRRHIQEHDVARLREAVTTRLNLEIAATEAMVKVALEHRPDLVSLVPETPDEITTEGGLDLTRHRARVEEVARRLAGAGVAVSLFLDPDPRQIEIAAGLPRETIGGFEINTDAYTRATLAAEEGGGGPGGGGTELEAVRRAARLGAEAGLHVYAGHGLTPGNVGAIARTPEIEELNIGHGLVARAVMVGMTEAVREFLRAMGAA